MIKLIINTLPPLALPPPHFRHQMPIAVHPHRSRCLHAYREIIVDKPTLSVNIVLDMFWINERLGIAAEDTEAGLVFFSKASDDSKT